MRVWVEDQPTTGYIPPRRLPHPQGSGLCVLALTLIGVTSITTAVPASATTASLQDAASSSTYITIIDSNAMSLGTLIKRFKENTGITWAQFASLFGVSRRAVHFWVEGGQMTAQNLERFEHLSTRLNQLRSLAPSAARIEILSPGVGGKSLFRELVEEVTQSADSQIREASPLGSDEMSSGLGAAGISVGTEDVDGITLQRH